MATITEVLDVAIAHHRAGQLGEAERVYRQILAVDPGQMNAWHCLGLVVHEQGRNDLAVEYIRKALALKPDFAAAHHNLGIALLDQAKTAEAIAAFCRAIELKPTFAEAHYNLGIACDGLGQWTEAMACFRKAIEHQPGHVDAHWNLAHLLLLTGDLENGWAEYEWRWKTGQGIPREFKQPQWEGQSLSGRSLLLHPEQGFGDTFQFVRYAALVKGLGATVLVECPQSLVPLLSQCHDIDWIIEEGNEVPTFDFHTPLLSLPGAFKTRLDTIPAAIPYLFASPALVAEWCEKLRDVRSFRIGINWQGRSGQGAFRHRDVPIDCFAPLAQIPGGQLIRLQKGAGSEELAAIGQRQSIIDLGPEIDTKHGAFMDTAAIMKNLDLVITSDTSIAHLAGALGVPVWTALPFVPDWRWLLDRTDSPWYPTMRLFRQKQLGDWAGVFGEIERELRRLVNEKQG